MSLSVSHISIKPLQPQFRVVGGIATSASPVWAGGAADDDEKKRKPKPLSERLGTIASNLMLGRSLLKLATSTGMPDPITVWMAARGVDRVSGKRLLPNWLQSGVVPDAISNLILGQAMVGSIEAVTPSAQTAARAEAASPPPTSGPPPSSSWRTGMSKLLKPLFYAGFTASSIAGVLALVERIKDKGTDGLISTTEGRGAVLGAVSGALILGSMYLPAGPAQLYTDLASNVSWMMEEVNGHGWLDPLLGADEPQPEDQATLDVPK